mgnify:CR=1 FL=1
MLLGQKPYNPVVMCFFELSKWTRRIVPILAGLFVAPSAVLASDFTPLFVLFVELPILGMSVLFLLICFGAPKVGLSLSSVLLFGSLFVVGWASGGYMDNAGGFLLSSLLVDIAGISIAIKKLNTAKKLDSSENR